MSSELEQVVQALQFLHGQHTPAEDRRKADLWLTQLRQSPEAWKVQLHDKCMILYRVYWSVVS